MLSDSESENFATLESLMEKCKKEREEKTLKVLAPYFEKIRILSNDIKKKENLLSYANLKINKIKDEYDEITKELQEEENNLNETYISIIEKEEFYLSPSNLELKELAERAREKKLAYSKMKNNYDNDKIYMNKKEEELDNRINNLSDKEHNLYLILKEYILNDKDLYKMQNELELLKDGNIQDFNDLIKDNKQFFRETKNKMRGRKNEINDIRDEIKNDYNRKARKSMNHLHFNNNMSFIKSHKGDDLNNSYLDNSSNNSNNSFIFNNSELNKTNSTINNRITNLNKTYYLRTNKPYHNQKNQSKNSFFNPNNNYKFKNYSQFLNTDSSDKGSVNNRNGRKDMHICKRLLKNYCNKYENKNNDFVIDLKIKEKKKNQSVPKNLYQQRRIIREGLDDYIYINGNRYKQSLIGKATNTVNGVY